MCVCARCLHPWASVSEGVNMWLCLLTSLRRLSMISFDRPLTLGREIKIIVSVLQEALLGRVLECTQNFASNFLKMF